MQKEKRQENCSAYTFIKFPQNLEIIWLYEYKLYFEETTIFHVLSISLKVSTAGRYEAKSDFFFFIFLKKKYF